MTENTASLGATSGYEAQQSHGSYEPTSGVVIAGRYVLEQKLGEGGMGEVWVANQSEPVKRKVALKLIKTGMDSKSVVQRFEQERQALAMMEHPNIARVLDGGITEDRRPFFVMELVNGLPLTKFCDEARLSIQDRLALFVPICLAVQHAHQKGIVHRDLKPGNILVTMIDGKPIPKVIDFGVAKATGGKLTDESMSTQFGAVIGTLEYMSPEQAGFSSEDIDTRADIYSLGIILYELLTGLRPFDSKRLKQAAFDELIRIIREEEPSKPSTRLSTDDSLASQAAIREIEPKKLTAVLRGELDWVVMKCLEKQRDRRYETANGLARDIQRYLADEPVEARPPSAGYRLRKYVLRNKGKVIAACLILLALVGGIIGTSIGLVLAVEARNEEAKRAEAETRERERAEKAEKATKQRADELKQVADFQAGMLEGIDPTKAGNELSQDVTAMLTGALAKAKPPLPEAEQKARLETFRKLWDNVNTTDAAKALIDRTIFKPALVTLDKQFKDQPLVAAQLRSKIGVRYYALGMFDAAMPLQREAYAIRRRLLGDEHEDTIDVHSEIGTLLHLQAKYKEAEVIYRDVLEKRRRVLGNDHVETIGSISNLGQLLQLMKRYPEGEQLTREALQRAQLIYGSDSPKTLVFLNNLGASCFFQNKLDECDACWTEVLEKRTRLIGVDHPETIVSQKNLAVLRKNQGRFAEAEKLYLDGIAKDRKVRGEEHPEVLNGLTNLATLLQSQNRFAEAEACFREVLEKSRRVRGSDHPATLLAVTRLSTAMQSQGRLDEAEGLLREVLERRLRLFGPDSFDTLDTRNNLAVNLSLQGKRAEAETIQREILEKRRRTLGADHIDVLISTRNLAAELNKQGKYAEALALLTSIEAKARQMHKGVNVFRVAHVVLGLGQAKAGLAKTSADFTQAEAYLLEARNIQAKSPVPPSHKDVRDSHKTLVKLYERWHQVEPGKGHDTQAANWKQKLAALPAAPQAVPANQPKVPVSK